MNKMIFKMAWRNLWRNRQRTMITLSSVFFAGLLCILLISYSDGMRYYVVDSVIARETGTFQVMGEDYWEDKVVDNFIKINPSVLESYEKVDNVKRIAPRIYTFAMGWNGAKTRPLSLIAIDPKREAAFAGLDTRMVEGEFLSQNDNGVVVGSECAKIMNLSVGDTLALVGQGYHGANAAQLFVVKGIIKCFSPLQNASTVYTSLSGGQGFLSMPNGVSSVSILVEDEDLLEETLAQIKILSNDEGMVQMGWEELIVGTTAGAMQEKKSTSVYFYFFYFIVFLGLLGSVIMLTSERIKEFGVMTAIGTRRSSLILGMFVELFIVTSLGLILSFAVAVPITAHFHYNPIEISGPMGEAFLEIGVEPIFPFAFNIGLFLEQILVIFIMALMVTLYPANKIRKMKIIDALNDK